MSDSKRDPLDQALAALSPDVTPGRDLWPGIRAEIEKTPIVTDAAPVVHHSFLRWYQAAAAVLLVVATSVTTYFVTRESLRPTTQVAVNEPLPAPTLNVREASFAQDLLGPKYVQTRADLDKAYEQRIAALPPATRAKLERNLAELRHATSEISATLAEHPSDPLLQELLVSTYQRELQFLSDVTSIPTQTPARTDL
jgi:hypothetical protein